MLTRSCFSNRTERSATALDRSALVQRCVALQPDNGCARLRYSAFARVHNRDDLEANLARDLGFALWRSSLRVKGKESQRIETCVMNCQGSCRTPQAKLVAVREVAANGAARLVSAMRGNCTRASNQSSASFQLGTYQQWGQPGQLPSRNSESNPGSPLLPSRGDGLRTAISSVFRKPAGG